MCYCISIACVKLSILLLITRIFLSVNRDIFFWVTQLLIWVNSLFYAIAVFLAIFACRPRRKIWNPDLPGHCLNSKSLYITSAAFNTASGVSASLFNALLVSCTETEYSMRVLFARQGCRTGGSLCNDDNTDSVTGYRHCYAFCPALFNLVSTDQLSA